jgi:hypothetical protein
MKGAARRRRIPGQFLVRRTDPFDGPSSLPRRGTGGGESLFPHGKRWEMGGVRKTQASRGVPRLVRDPPSVPLNCGWGDAGGSTDRVLPQAPRRAGGRRSCGPRPGTSEADAQCGARTRGPRASGEAAGAVTGPARGAVRQDLARTRPPRATSSSQPCGRSRRGKQHKDRRRTGGRSTKAPRFRSDRARRTSRSSVLR